jgi:hypothetical protein
VPTATARYTEIDPHRAFDIFLEGLAYTRHHRQPFNEALIVSRAAGLVRRKGTNGSYISSNRQQPGHPTDPKR